MLLRLSLLKGVWLELSHVLSGTLEGRLPECDSNFASVNDGRAKRVQIRIESAHLSRECVKHNCKVVPCNESSEVLLYARCGLMMHACWFIGSWDEPPLPWPRRLHIVIGHDELSRVRLFVGQSFEAECARLEGLRRLGTYVQYVGIPTLLLYGCYGYVQRTTIV